MRGRRMALKIFTEEAITQNTSVALLFLIFNLNHSPLSALIEYELREHQVCTANFRSESFHLNQCHSVDGSQTKVSQRNFMHKGLPCKAGHGHSASEAQGRADLKDRRSGTRAGADSTQCVSAANCQGEAQKLRVSARS